jgi:adenylate kinase family enzyme
MSWTRCITVRAGSREAAFRSEVEEFVQTQRWVTEDQYRTVLGDLLLARADTYICLDLPRRTVLFRVIRRSLVRALTRRELWNSNRENFRDWLDPEHPIRTWCRSMESARSA